MVTFDLPTFALICLLWWLSGALVERGLILLRRRALASLSEREQ